MYTFDWDENKNRINQRKHGISFVEACSVFFDERAILFDDPIIQMRKKGSCYWGSVMQLIYAWFAIVTGNQTL